MKITLLTFLLSYILFFIIYFIFVYLKSRKTGEILDGVQASFLKGRFGFKNKELNAKKLALIVTFTDPLIIALTGTIVTSFKMHFIIRILIGFVFLMAFIFSFYEIIGRVLKRKINKKKDMKKRKEDKNV